jgi:hypothetical protein
MKRLSTSYLAVATVATALTVACAAPEKIVVEKYFQAVNTGDNQTLGSFAAVTFDKKVDNWSIKRTVSENTEAAPLSGLLKKQKEVEGQIADNKREYTSYNLEHTAEVTEVREARKSGDKVPAKLSAVAADWEKFTDKEKELKKALSEAKSAVEKEKKAMTLSIGNVDDFEGLEGELKTKQIELELTIGGTPESYLMTLKKYEMKSGGTARVISRWIIANLQKA